MCSDQRMVTSLAFSSSRTRFSPNTKSSAGGAANTRGLTWAIGGGRRRGASAAGGGDASGRERRRGKDWAPPVGRRDGRGRRRHGRNQPPIATLDSHLAQLGFAQQHVLRLRLALHPVADIRLVVHRGAAGARPGARYSDAERGRDAIRIWVFHRNTEEAKTKTGSCSRQRTIDFHEPKKNVFVASSSRARIAFAPPLVVASRGRYVATVVDDRRRDSPPSPPPNARVGSSSCVGSS